MRVHVAILCCGLLAVFGCGSPEDFQKQGREADSAVDVAVGLGLPKEYGPWARAHVSALGAARQLQLVGDTAPALRAADSLITEAERSMDTIPFLDPRSKFLGLLLTDAYSQSIAWQLERGDTAGARLRTNRYEALAARVHQLSDSVKQLQ